MSDPKRLSIYDAGQVMALTAEQWHHILRDEFGIDAPGISLQSDFRRDPQFVADVQEYRRRLVEHKNGNMPIVDRVEPVLHRNRHSAATTLDPAGLLDINTVDAMLKQASQGETPLLIGWQAPESLSNLLRGLTPNPVVTASFIGNKWQNVDLENVIFQNTRFNHSLIEQSVFSNCSFDGCSSYNACFSDCTFHQSLLKDWNLERTRFKNVTFDQVDFSQLTNISAATFEQVQINDNCTIPAHIRAILENMPGISFVQNVGTSKHAPLALPAPEESIPDPSKNLPRIRPASAEIHLRLADEEATLKREGPLGRYLRMAKAMNLDEKNGKSVVVDARDWQSRQRAKKLRESEQER